MRHIDYLMASVISLAIVFGVYATVQTVNTNKRAASTVKFNETYGEFKPFAEDIKNGLQNYREPRKL